MDEVLPDSIERGLISSAEILVIFVHFREVLQPCAWFYRKTYIEDIPLINRNGLMALW